MKRLLFKIQDWLADNTTLVQYPRQRLEPRPLPAADLTANEGQRLQILFLGLLSPFVILMALTVLAACALVLWAMWATL